MNNAIGCKQFAYGLFFCGTLNIEHIIGLAALQNAEKFYSE